MSHLAEIKTKINTRGRTRRYLQIDVTPYKNNELFEDLLEDFLDCLEIERRKNEPTIPFSEFIKQQNLKRGLA